MHQYPQVVTRFLHKTERLIASNEQKMPLVIESKSFRDVGTLQIFAKQHSQQLMDDLAQYGAILFRGFDITSELDFEQTVLSIQGMRGISTAFMSEDGRIHSGQSKYILHTNAIYKTGGTMYLGGFHTENYYAFDVPSYICFACFKPSKLGGETGLINMKKIYAQLRPELKQKLEQNSFFVQKWLVSEVSNRYQVSCDKVQNICAQYQIPLHGQGQHQFIYMYKPNVLQDAATGEKSLQINLFEIYRLNANLRKIFMQDYAGKPWFWHRFVWKLPKYLYKTIKFCFIHVTAFSYSPKAAIAQWGSQLRAKLAEKHNGLNKTLLEQRVGSCFTQEDVKQLAQLMRAEYCSSIWQQGDILIVDNKQVAHAGMPGSGDRLIRAMICNPLTMTYTKDAPGVFVCEERAHGEIGAQLNNEAADNQLTNTPATSACS